MNKNSSKPAIGPAYALVEVMMHELANPVQAARTSIRLLQNGQLSQADALLRVQSLETALERVAMVIRNVQAVKESTLFPPAAVSSDRLLADISSECAAIELPMKVEDWPTQPVMLRLHGAAIPLLVSSWALGSKADGQLVHLRLRIENDAWAMRAKLRDGDNSIISKKSSATSVAGYPAVIGEFMNCAGGSAFVNEDDNGTFEICLNIETWN